MILTPTGNWMSTPAMIINASVPPPPALHSTHSLLCQTRGRTEISDQNENEKRCKKSEQVGVHLIYSAHFLPPTCVQPQDASGHNYSEDPSLKCTNPEPGAAAVVDVFASESSQGNGHHLLSLNRALWMMIVNWPNSAPRCNRDNKDNGPVTGGHCSAPAWINQNYLRNWLCLNNHLPSPLFFSGVARLGYNDIRQRLHIRLTVTVWQAMRWEQMRFTSELWALSRSVFTGHPPPRLENPALSVRWALMRSASPSY